MQRTDDDEWIGMRRKRLPEICLQMVKRFEYVNR